MDKSDSMEHLPDVIAHKGDIHAVLNTRDIDRRDDPQGLFSE